MSKRVIVTGGTRSDTAAIAVFAMNIKETNGHLFTKLIIFHDGIKIKDQQLIKEIIDTEFIFYKFPDSTKNDIIINYFTAMLFCKYECFKLLQEYDIVVWSDYDVIIKEELDEICQFERSFLKIVVDGKYCIRDMFYSEINNKEIYNYDLSKEGLTTPLFSISNEIGDYMEMYNWCYKKTIEYDEDLMLAEQCIFSLVVQEYSKMYEKLDALTYACHPRDAKGNEKILHSYGQPKFWSGLYDEKWTQMYKRWISMGGSPYSHVKKTIRVKIRLILSRISGIRARK